MLTYRQLIIRDLFKYLEQHNYIALKYILTNAEDLPLSSDIDLLVNTDTVSALQAFYETHELVKHIQYEHVNERTSLHLYLHDGSYLKIDLLTRLIWKNFIYLRQQNIHRHCINQEGVITYSPAYLFRHIVMYYALNEAAIPEKYIHYFKQFPTETTHNILHFFNLRHSTNITSIDTLSHYNPVLKRQLLSYLKHFKYNHFFHRAIRSLKSINGRVKDRIPKRGKVITFTGVDGAGKTTLLKDFAYELQHHQKVKIKLLRHRPSLLPILSAWRYGQQEAERRSIQSLPRQGTNTSLLQSILRFTYYYIDYIIGQLWVYCRYCLLGYTVLYDRYYFDFIVDGKRSNIQLQSSWPRWLYFFIIKPQLNFFLYASPRTIRIRKQELPRHDIINLTQAYSTLFLQLKEQSLHRYHLIENEDRRQSMRQLLLFYYQKIT